MTLPPEMTLHIGSARTQARVRLLGASAIARLMLRDALPLHVGDRVLLRDPGGAGVAILGATVLDVAPPAFTRRGAAAAAGAELGAWPDLPSAADLLRRHGFLRAGALAAMGVSGGPPPVAGDWLADPARWACCAAGWPRRWPPTPGATRWPSACRPRPPAPPSACPTGR